MERYCALALARAHQQLMRGMIIETIELDVWAERVSQGLLRWTISLEKNGDRIDFQPGTLGSLDEGPEPTEVCVRRAFRRLLYITPKEGWDDLCLYCVCWAPSEKIALEIANSARLKIQADGNWVEGYAADMGRIT